MTSTAIEIRPPAVAGAFYPGDPAELRAKVDALLSDPHGDLPLEKAEPAAVPPKILIVPHAGYVYSGAVAAAAYRLLAPHRSRIRRVVLLGPAHRVAFEGIALPAARALRTPLGVVEIDLQAVAALRGLPKVGASEQAHAAEHCLEVQLPFLQRVLADFKVVPALVGRCDPSLVVSFIERLWGGDDTVVLISSDLSHYLPDGDARRKDAASVRAILAREPRLDHHDACGATPVNAALRCATVHGLEPRLLTMCNSSDTIGDKGRVVGYCSVAFDRAAVAAPKLAGGAEADDHARLGDALLTLARGAIADAFEQAATSPLRSLPATTHPRLDAPGATFVTLTLDGALRGCIGSLQAWRPLRTDVVENARASAFRDPRFPGLSAQEYPRVRVEVSLLGPAEPFPVDGEADAIARLRPGVDGVILAWRDRRATFLPQVWSQLPDPRTFLAHLRHKAGLRPDFWAPDLQLSRYRVDKWVEPGAVARTS